MTASETAKVLGVLRAAYPNFYKGMGRGELENIVALWTDMFADDDVTVVATAVKSLIASDEKGYPPHIGAIKEHIHKVTHQTEMTEGEAWAMIRKAVSNGYYGYAEEYAKLPPTLQRLVGSATQLRDWSQMDVDEFNSVVASNVQRAYRTVVAREKEQAKLPESVRMVISAAAERARLGDGS